MHFRKMMKFFEIFLSESPTNLDLDMDIVWHSEWPWPVNHPVLPLPPFTQSRQWIKARISLWLSSGWCPPSRNVWINFGAMRCGIFFWSNWCLEKRTMCLEVLPKRLSNFWNYITQQIYEDHKRLINVFLLKALLESFLFCVWIQSCEKRHWGFLSIYRWSLSCSPFR